MEINQELKIFLKNENLNIYFIEDQLNNRYIYKILNNDFVIEKDENYKYWDYKLTKHSLLLDDNATEKTVEYIVLKKKSKKFLLDDDLIEILFNIICDQLSLNPQMYMIDVLKKCEKIFEKQKLTIESKKLEGFMGELLFLYKNISFDKYFHSNDELKFDFYVYDKNKYIEVKSTIGVNNKFTIKEEQIQYDIEKTIICFVNLVQDDNGEDITFFINYFKNTQNKFLQNHLEALNLLADDYPYIKHFKINLLKSNISICKASEIPYLKFKNISEAISEISYKLDISNLKKYEIADLL